MPPPPPLSPTVTCLVVKPLRYRAEREAAYDSRKSDMGKWVAPVQANRKAETLDFTPMVSKASKRRGCLVSPFSPPPSN